jgi:hypothetical protein
VNVNLTVKELRQAKADLENQLSESFPIEAAQEFYEKTGITVENVKIHFTVVTTFADYKPKHIVIGVEVVVEDIGL